LPVFILAILSMVPFVILAEKKRRMKPVFLAFIGLIGLSNLGFLILSDLYWGVFALLYVFFTGFNLLEATLPSMVSKIAPPDQKGTAMGVYSTSQFLGAFIGGVGAGWIHGHYGLAQVFVFSAIAAFLWLIVAAFMAPPRHLSSLLLNIEAIPPKEAEPLNRRLLSVPGVAEAVVVPEDGVAYLKIDKPRLDRDALAAALGVIPGS
jgi:MFS family permease